MSPGVLEGMIREISFRKNLERLNIQTGRTGIRVSSGPRKYVYSSGESGRYDSPGS